MPEQFHVDVSVFDGQHNLGGTSFNLYKLDLTAENGVEYQGIECWRPADKDAIFAGENYIGTVEQAGKDRRKFKPDWRATNELRRNGGGGEAEPQPAPQQPTEATPPQPPAPTPTPAPQATDRVSDRERQASIERQSAQQRALEYAALVVDRTGEVPSIADINKWTEELNG